MFLGGEMNKEKCLWCENPMGNSLNKINGYPIHKHCEEDNSIIKILDKIKKLRK